MKKHHSLLALAMLLSSIAFFTQNSFQKQINAVGGSVSDPRMAAIDGGGTIITGSYVSSRVSLNKVMLAKLDKDGEPLWARAFGSDNANYYPLAVIPCRDGGFVVAGESLDVGFNVFVVKYTGTGVLSWQRKFNYSASGYYSMYLRAGIAASDSTILLTGTTNLSSLGDAFVLNMNQSDGNVNWFRAAGTAGLNETGYNINRTPDNGFVIGGWSGYPGSLGDNFLVVKYNRKGRPEWSKTFWNTNATGNDEITGIAAAPDGGYVFTGDTYTSNNSYDRVLVKLAADGSLEWGRQLKMPSYDVSADVINTKDGSYIIGGSNGNGNAVVTRFTADGDSAFTTRFDTFRNYGSLMRQGKKIYSVTSSAISARSAIVITGYDSLVQTCDAVTTVDTVSNFPLNTISRTYHSADLTDSLISYPSLLSDTAITLVTKLLCWDSVPVPVTQNDVSDITAKGATAVAVSVYPNPVAGSSLHIRLSGFTGPVTVLISDMQGPCGCTAKYPI